MKIKLEILLLVLVFFIVTFFGWKMIGRPIGENDEQIYLTTFLLVNRGYKLYKEVFFSQMPAFFLLTYPGFIIFGKTLQAARFTIYLWSSLSMLLMILLGFKLKKNLIGVMVLLLLLLIPTYRTQIATFQSDALAVSLSLLSFEMMIFFRINQNRLYLVLSAFFFSLAFWTKLDLSVLATLFYLLAINLNIVQSKNKHTEKLNLKNYLIFILLFCFCSLMFAFLYGTKNIIENVLLLRTAALKVYSFDLSRILSTIVNDKILLATGFCAIIFFVLSSPKIKSIVLSLLIWLIIAISLIFLYRPIFLHHLVFLSVPSVLLFSFSIEKFRKTFAVVLLIIFFSVLFSLINTIHQSNNELISSEKKHVVNIIEKSTLPTDFVVSDEEIFNAFSGRLPPPPLADLSFVRIKSGNLAASKFLSILDKYKPKLIISWNGRLKSMPFFNEIIKKDYRLVYTLDNYHEIYLLASGE